MTQTGTQQTKNSCSRCYKTFDSPQELREHEQQCKGGGVSTGDPANANAESRKKSREAIERDMLIEEGFEATDN
jgi:hypothetical protein